MRLDDWLPLAGACFHWGAPRFWPRLLRLTLQSCWNEGMARLEEASLGTAIDRQQPPPPLFVLGCWRSGTTWLHRLLGCDPGMAFPTTLQVLNPHTFALLEGRLPGWRARWSRRLYQVWARLCWGGEALSWKRLSDGLPMALEQPGEDEYAMLMQGRSDLLAHLVGRRRAGHFRRYLTLSQLEPGERRQWQRLWLRFLGKLSLHYPGRRLVLKSPNHTARVRSLLELHPEASFLHIHRHPFEVYRSFRRHLELIFKWGDVLEPGRPDPEELCLELYDTLYAAYLRDREAIPPGQLYELSYDGLKRDPVGQLEAAYRALGLPNFERVRLRLPRVNEHRETAHPPLDGATQERIRQRWGRYFVAFGYA